MATPRLTVKQDNVKKVFQSIRDLVGQQVLIGIPDDNAGRKDGDPANNALIGYVMEFGSPAQNIPARAFLIPGVEKAETPALYQLRQAAKAALDGDKQKMEQKLNAAGIVGANSARYEINNGDFAPLSPQTILNRNRARGTKSHRKNELQYLALYSSGMSAIDAESIAGIKPLINTAQLRNSITYVLRKL
jgi:hypothetical protein